MSARKKGTKAKKTSAVERKILINVGPVEKRVAITEGEQLVDFILERESAEHYAGSIYKGIVKSVIPGIEAAFVDIGLDKNAFLHVSDLVDNYSALKDLLSEEDAPKEKRSRRGKKSSKIENVLSKGDEIMVQVVKESIGTKGPRVTTYVSLAGRFLVLTPHDKGVGISRRIDSHDERKRIRDVLKEIGVPDGLGCIVRTVAEGRSSKDLQSEYRYLQSLWGRIKSRAESQKAPVAVYEEYGLVLRMIRDIFTEEISQLLVDSKDEYGRIVKFLNSFMPSLKKRVKLYRGKTPLFQRYKLEKQIDQIFERKVDLKSGGHMVIDLTEGVVVIDVNSGSFTGKKNLEDTAFKTNMEAAREIPRQLKLRDIGGIIIIDFIDMEDRSNRGKIYRALKSGLEEDKARINVEEISRFGIVEMTRQRMRKSLESSSYTECPYCAGRGMIKSVETIAIEVVRKIDRTLSRAKKQKKLVVTSHPEVHTALISDQAKMLGDIQRKYRCEIELRENKQLHAEDVTIEQK